MTKASPALVVPMRRAFWLTVLAIVLAPALAALIGLGGGPAVGYGVLIGLELPLLFFGVTTAVALLTATSSVGKLGTVVLGSWLGKIAVLIAALAWLRGQDFYSRPVFFGVFLVTIVMVLVGEAWIVKRAKVPFVDV